MERVTKTNGSLLTANVWDPLLNNGFILGGAHGNVEFHYAVASDDEVAATGVLDIFQRLVRSRSGYDFSPVG
jgi:hypothetical protein